MLVERHSISYSDFVSNFWPEFAQNGKEQITIEDLLNHKAGLAALDTPILIDDALFNPKKISTILERQTPNWKPVINIFLITFKLKGTKSGYHAVTFGWLLDQLGNVEFKICFFIN